MGSAVGVDPGKPGIGPFGREIYQSGTLCNVAAELTPSIRHKRTAMLRRDDPEHAGTLLPEIEAERTERLAEAVFRGIVLDYDGTIVPTEHKYDQIGRATCGEREGQYV